MPPLPKYLGLWQSEQTHGTSATATLFFELARTISQNSRFMMPRIKI